MAASPHAVQDFLDVLADAQSRECELEDVYIEGRATATQLAELEKVRQLIEDCLIALEETGYFNPS